MLGRWRFQFPVHSASIKLIITTEKPFPHIPLLNIISNYAMVSGFSRLTLLNVVLFFFTSQNILEMTFAADAIDFAFFGAEPPVFTLLRLLFHLVFSGGLTVMVTNRFTTSVGFLLNRPNIAAKFVWAFSFHRHSTSAAPTLHRGVASLFFVQDVSHTFFRYPHGNYLTHLHSLIVQHDIVQFFDSFQCSCGFWPSFTGVNCEGRATSDHF